VKNITSLDNNNYVLMPYKDASNEKVPTTLILDLEVLESIKNLCFQRRLVN
jgi:hypothetical protein